MKLRGNIVEPRLANPEPVFTQEGKAWSILTQPYFLDNAIHHVLPSQNVTFTHT